MEYNITYRQKDKGWQYIISYKVNRKWKQVSKQGFKSRASARIAADKRTEELRDALKYNVDVNSDFSSITLKELKDLYINNKHLYVSDSTIENMKYAYKAFEQLGEYKVKDIKKNHIQDGITRLMKNGNKSVTIHTRVNYLKVLFNYGINEYNIMSINPVKGVQIKDDKNKDTRKALTDKESNDLLNALYGTRYYLVALIALKSGLRIGEILGLTYGDIDFINNTIDVNKQFKRFSGEVCAIGELKSKNSIRLIPAPKIVIDEIKKYKSKQGDASPTDLIFNFGAKKSFETVMNKYMKTKGFNVCLHELRHTYATKLIASGLDLKTTAYLLGHDIKMTMNIYSHVTDDMIKNANKIINENFN